MVEEYKELLKTTVLQLQEEGNRQLTERLREESERFTALLEDQVKGELSADREAERGVGEIYCFVGR